VGPRPLAVLVAGWPRGAAGQPRRPLWSPDSQGLLALRKHSPGFVGTEEARALFVRGTALQGSSGALWRGPACALKSPVTRRFQQWASKGPATTVALLVSSHPSRTTPCRHSEHGVQAFLVRLLHPAGACRGCLGLLRRASAACACSACAARAGRADTPLWRNGPPEKPVLCNACGSRWRTRGTLENYMPLHAGGWASATRSRGLQARAAGHSGGRTAQQQGFGVCELRRGQCQREGRLGVAVSCAAPALAPDAGQHQAVHALWHPGQTPRGRSTARPGVLRLGGARARAPRALAPTRGPQRRCLPPLQGPRGCWPRGQARGGAEEGPGRGGWGARGCSGTRTRTRTRRGEDEEDDEFDDAMEEAEEERGRERRGRGRSWRTRRRRGRRRRGRRRGLGKRRGWQEGMLVGRGRWVPGAHRGRRLARRHWGCMGGAGVGAGCPLPGQAAQGQGARASAA